MLDIMTLNEMEREAMQNYSNYVGGEEGFYVGEDEDIVHFNGDLQGLPTAAKFAQEAVNAHTFQLRIISAAASDRTVYLKKAFSAYTGLVGDAGVLVEGTFFGVESGSAEITGVGLTSNITKLLKWSDKNPLRITGMRLNADATQLEALSFDIQTYSPFETLKSRKILVNTYINEKNYRDNIISVPEGFQFDDQVDISFKLLAGKTLTITLLCGGNVNMAATLANKAKKAGRQLAAGMTPLKAKVLAQPLKRLG